VSVLHVLIIVNGIPVQIRFSSIKLFGGLNYYLSKQLGILLSSFIEVKSYQMRVHLLESQVPCIGIMLIPEAKKPIWVNKIKEEALFEDKVDLIASKQALVH